MQKQPNISVSLILYGTYIFIIAHKQRKVNKQKEKIH